MKRVEDNPPLMFLSEALMLELRCHLVIDRCYGGQRFHKIVGIFLVCVGGIRTRNGEPTWHLRCTSSEISERRGSRAPHIGENGAFPFIVINAIHELRRGVVVIVLRFYLLLEKSSVETQAETLGAVRVTSPLA